MRKLRKKARKKKFSSFLPFVFFNLLLVFVFLLILSFYFVFFRLPKIKVLSSSVSNLQTISSLQKSLDFEFSFAPDKKLVEKTFKIRPQVLGVLTWKNDKKLSFQFEERLPSKTKFLAEFSYSSPSPFFPTTTPEVYNLQFETGEAPEVVFSSPKDNEKNVFLKKYLIFEFDRPMQEKNIKNYFLIKPKTEGDFLVRGKQLIFKPKEKLKSKTEYFAGILKGVSSLNGQQLIDDYFIHFKTVSKNGDGFFEKRKADVPVLMFHNVGNVSFFDTKLTKRFKISPENLEKLLKFVSQKYQTVSMEELYDYLTNGVKLPENPIVLTFDDGWSGVFKFAFPLLKKYKLKFSSYLISSYIDKNPDYLKKEEVFDMLNSGLMELGNHTKSHALLGFVSRDVLKKEINGAQDDFEQMFGVRPLTFAYPGGSYNKNVIDEVDGAGFHTAVTVKQGKTQSEDELLLLKRIEVEGTDSVKDLERKLNM